MDRQSPFVKRKKITTWKKMIQLYSERGPAGVLRHIRAVLWLRAHAWWDRRIRNLNTNDETASNVVLDEVSIRGPNRDAGIDYEPAPWSVLDWVQEALPQPTAEWSFVDFGAGKGRVVLHASRLPYGNVVGVEFAKELVESAQELLEAAPIIRAGSVEIINQDAAEYKLPDTSVVAFFFNPFDPPVINRVATTIAQSYKECPRPIYIVYLNPVHHDVFDDLEDFNLVKLAWSTGLKFRALSPNSVRLYATREATSREALEAGLSS
ncbi:MAG: class I SAM-dependent methyltransferase [Hyphomicrobiaceae bacterium]